MTRTSLDALTILLEQLESETVTEDEKTLEAISVLYGTIDKKIEFKNLINN